MYEFAELLILEDHTCADPRPERVEVYEPVRMLWQWLTVFECCSLVFSEPGPAQAPVWRPVAVKDEAAA